MQKSTRTEQIQRRKENKVKSYKKHLINKRYRPEYRLREFLSEIRRSNRYGSMVNCIRLSKANSLLHENTKVRICQVLLSLGHDFITEAIFNNGKRADVIDLYEGIAYEITVSESDKSIQEKNKTYPESLEVKKIDAKTFKECDLL